MYCNIHSVNTLTTLLVAHGIHHVVVCPGSRNAPLVHNFSQHPDIICHPATDERSAAFIALGLRSAVGEPVAVCVTSGSAVLNVMPAVAEATYRRQGIIVISADRPQAWIDQLDGQTLPQHDALGRFAPFAVSLPEPHNDDERWLCNRLCNEALIMAKRSGGRSVHINVPLSEPLFDFSTERLPDERVVNDCHWDEETERNWCRSVIASSKRLLIVMGQMLKHEVPVDTVMRLQRHCVVLHEPLSADLRQPSLVEEMMCAMPDSDNDTTPDCLIFIGGHTVSKRLRQYIRRLPGTTRQIVVNTDGRLTDISQHTAILVNAGTQTFLNDICHDICHDKDNAGDREAASAETEKFVSAWRKLRERAARHRDGFKPDYSQMLAVKGFEDIVDADRDTVFYANSMPVRLAAVYAQHFCHCNRGLNGIEGSLSVAVGAALATRLTPDGGKGENGQMTYCVIGDLSFFYDRNALWQNSLPKNLRILLLNNSGGGIFRNLPHLADSPVANSLIAGGHTTDAEGTCRQHGLDYLTATDERSLAEGLRQLRRQDRQRPALLEVFTDADMDSKVYKEYLLCCQLVY